MSTRSHSQRDRIVIYLFPFPQHPPQFHRGNSPKDREAGIFTGNSRNFLSTRFSHLALFPFVSSYLPFCLGVIQKDHDESPTSGPLTPTKRLGKKKERSRKYVSRNISGTIECFYLLSHESALDPRSYGTSTRNNRYASKQFRDHRSSIGTYLCTLQRFML